jgi:predicted dehydrogenase
MSANSRRDFLKTSAVSTAGAAVMPAFAWSQKSFANESPNDRPRIGCIGLGGMGRWDAREHHRFGDILICCDVDGRHAGEAIGEEGIGKRRAIACTDYRRVLDRDDIDVVSVVTPDHWHVKIAIEALEAGKHVFCQKPLTLTLEENQLIRNACRKHQDKVFFVGTQQRSDKDRFLRAVNMVQKGLLGEIRKITVGINGGDVGGPFETKDVPGQFDWERWLGQAPKVDYIPQRSHGSFRWWYEYSGGKFTDWGAHHIDIALWALERNGEGQGPTVFDGTDAKHPVPFEKGYPTQDDSYNAAHDYAIKCTFDDGVEMIVDSRSDNGILFEGTKGRIFVNRGKITGQPIDENWDRDQFSDEELQQLYKGKPFEGHKQNFYRCLSEGGLPVSDVYSHLQTMASCHLCAIAARLNRVIRWDPQSERIVGDEEAATFFAREQRKGYEIARV